MGSRNQRSQSRSIIEYQREPAGSQSRWVPFRLAGPVLAALIGMLGAPTEALALDFEVTRLDDPDPTVNPCNSGIDCSLRAAIILANETAGADRIVFSALAGMYTFCPEEFIPMC